MKVILYAFLSVLLFNIHGCNSTQTIPCAYIPQITETNQYPEITQYEDCAQLDSNNNIVITEKHMKQIWFDEAELAEIRVHDGIYYLNKQGKLVRSHKFDNGADYFKEGLSRIIQNDKFGFVNKKLEVVIPAKYDFAYPFNNGISKVCYGCKVVKVDEHKEMKGGKWGAIDKAGNIKIEISHDYDKLDEIKIN
ncbi:MAG: WG repeat-containing protein [Gammaproteobacteria bacterium]|nr:WG repeat-containing protein [Gammaproteobacteria bacterium]